MLLAQRQLRPYSAANFLSPPLPPFPFSLSFNLPFRPTKQNSRRTAHKTWIAQLSEEPPPPPLRRRRVPSSSLSDEPTPLLTATSALLTGAITVFLFRSLRRRAMRAKETRISSSREKKSLTEEAAESLKSVTLSPVGSKSPPSPVQAFLGAVAAGVIALILFKFTITVEYALSRQTISDNYSARQITITIRTIIKGLCYLSTFVFGANSVGLFLYSGQLAINSFVEDCSNENESEASSSSSSSGTSNSKSGCMDGSVISSASEDQSSDST